MTPGIAIDYLVAEKVMGWIGAKQHGESLVAFDNGRCISRSTVTDGNGKRLDFAPSLDIAHAWEVVRFMSKKDHQNAIWWNCTAGAFICLDVDEPFPKSLGRLIHDCPDKVPFAICLAALMAVGAIEVQ